jgi:hypothetical protein
VTLKAFRASFLAIVGLNRSVINGAEAPRLSASQRKYE